MTTSPMYLLFRNGCAFILSNPPEKWETEGPGRRLAMVNCKTREAAEKWFEEQKPRLEGWDRQ